MARDFTREPEPARPWLLDRIPPNPPPEEGGRPPHERRIMGIHEALVDMCNIPVRQFFLVTMLEDGRCVTFTKPVGGIPPHMVSRFFDRGTFIAEVRGMEAMQASTATTSPTHGLDSPLDSPSVFYSPPPPPAPPPPPPLLALPAPPPPLLPPFMSDYHQSGRRRARRQAFPDLYDDGPFAAVTGGGMGGGVVKSRRGPRSQKYRVITSSIVKEEEDPGPVIRTAPTKRGIKIGSSQEVWDFYEQRFKNCQQTACKIMAKAWVKAIAPKKQSNNPYTGQESTAPFWWPKPWGQAENERVRHKEPDHLYKRERVYLLNHLLRLITFPERERHPDIQKLGLTVRKLEEVTHEALSAFYSDSSNPANGAKKVFVDEIFKVAKMEQRFRSGEIDPATEVYVMADDKGIEGYQSENEDATPARADSGPGSVARVSPSSTGGSGIQPERGAGSSSNASPTATVASSAAYLIEAPPSLPQQQPCSLPAPPSLRYLSGPLYGHTHHHHNQQQQPSAVLPGDGHHGGYTDSTSHVRLSQQHQQQQQQHSNHGLQQLGEMVTSPHDSGRRTAMFSATDYVNPGGSGSLYGAAAATATAAWQQQPTSTGQAAATAMYGFPHNHHHHHHHPSHSHHDHSPPQNHQQGDQQQQHQHQHQQPPPPGPPSPFIHQPPGQSYLSAAAFDHMSAGTVYDPSQEALFRTANPTSHGGIPQLPPFPGSYYAGDARRSPSGDGGSSGGAAAAAAAAAASPVTKSEAITPESMA